MVSVRAILDRKGSEVFSIDVAESVLDAARLMNTRGIGGVVVTRDGEMVGIFTERDVLRRVVAEQLDPAATVLESVMTTPVVSCESNTGLDECMQTMSNRRVRHLPVVDGGQLAGILTSGDIVAHQVREQQDTIEHLSNYIHDPR
jgi:CBS domain-containing protein